MIGPFLVAVLVASWPISDAIVSTQMVDSSVVVTHAKLAVQHDSSPVAASQTKTVTIRPTLASE